MVRYFFIVFVWFCCAFCVLHKSICNSYSFIFQLLALNLPISISFPSPQKKTILCYSITAGLSTTQKATKTFIHFTMHNQSQLALHFITLVCPSHIKWKKMPIIFKNIFLQYNKEGSWFYSHSPDIFGSERTLTNATLPVT